MTGRCQLELRQYRQAHDSFTAAVEHNAKLAEVSLLSSSSFEFLL